MWQGLFPGQMHVKVTCIRLTPTHRMKYDFHRPLTRNGFLLVAKMHSNVNIVEIILQKQRSYFGGVAGIRFWRNVPAVSFRTNDWCRETFCPYFWEHVIDIPGQKPANYVINSTYYLHWEDTASMSGLFDDLTSSKKPNHRWASGVPINEEYIMKRTARGRSYLNSSWLPSAELPRLPCHWASRSPKNVPTAPMSRIWVHTYNAKRSQSCKRYNMTYKRLVSRMQTYYQSLVFVLIHQDWHMLYMINPCANYTSHHMLE